MGVEFTQNTSGQRLGLERFLKVLMENRTLLPELFVQPEGLESDNRNPTEVDSEDPLLQLFHGEALSAEAFHEALRSQRGVGAPSAATEIAATHA